VRGGGGGGSANGWKQPSRGTTTEVQTSGREESVPPNQQYRRTTTERTTKTEAPSHKAHTPHPPNKTKNIRHNRTPNSARKGPPGSLLRHRPHSMASGEHRPIDRMYETTRTTLPRRRYSLVQTFSRFTAYPRRPDQTCGPPGPRPGVGTCTNEFKKRCRRSRVARRNRAPDIHQECKSTVNQAILLLIAIRRVGPCKALTRGVFVLPQMPVEQVHEKRKSLLRPVTKHMGI